MSKYLFIGYTCISILLCVFYTYSGRYQMPFDYEKIFTVQEIIYYSSIIIFGCVFFLASYYYSFRKVKIVEINHGTVQFNPTNKLVLFSMIQIFILVYFLFEFYFSLKSTNGSDYIQDYRPLGGKFSNFILFIQAFLIFAIWRKVYYILIFSIFSFFISFLFAWVDSSRASIIPLLGLLYFLYKERKYFSFCFVFSFAIFCYMTAIIARNYYDRIDLYSLLLIVSEVFLNFNELLVWVVSYFTAFSIFQFAYITRDSLGHFSLYDLFYSITPLPSFLWAYSPDYENWRADEFRPMGAISEVFRVSPVFFYIYFCFKGFLAKGIDSIVNIYAKLLATAIFFMTIIMMFQYNLRSIQWFYYFILLLILLDRRCIFERSFRFYIK